MNDKNITVELCYHRNGEHPFSVTVDHPDYHRVAVGMFDSYSEARRGYYRTACCMSNNDYAHPDNNDREWWEAYKQGTGAHKVLRYEHSDASVRISYVEPMLERGTGKWYIAYLPGNGAAYYWRCEDDAAVLDLGAWLLRDPDSVLTERACTEDEWWEWFRNCSYLGDEGHWWRKLWYNIGRKWKKS